MTQLAQRLTSRFEELLSRVPDSEQAIRSDLLQHFLAQGFPHKRMEAWRYTDLSALNEVDWALSGLPDHAPELDRARITGAVRQVFINGLFAAHLSDEAGDWPLTLSPRPQQPQADALINSLNGAFATAGVQVEIGAHQTLSAPLHLLSWQDGGDQGMSHLRHHLKLGEGAEAVVVLEHLGQSGLCTHHLDAELGPGARLSLYCLQHEGDAVQHLGELQIQQAADSQLQLVTVDCGLGLTRRDLRIQLKGAGAEAHLAGAYALSARSHLDNQASIEHLEPKATGRQTWRGVLDGQSKAVLNSRVLMAKDAQQSDSEQSLAHLLLQAGPEVNAKPELEIYADDVKAAHGATVGQLDQNALHYLRSRGLDVQTARNLLTYTFVQQALSQIHHDAVRERADELLRKRLPGLMDLEVDA